MLPEVSRPGVRLIHDISEVLPVTPVLSSREHAWRGLDVMRFRHTLNEIDLPAFDSHAVILFLGSPINITERIDGRVYQKRLSKKDVVVIPSGVPNKWNWKERVVNDTLHIYLAPTFVREIAETIVDTDRVEVVNTLGARDQQVEYLGLALMAELEASCPSPRLYGESLAQALAVRLISGYSTSKTITRKYRGGLSGYKLRRVTSYIDDNLQHDLSLAELAGVAGMSTYHFARQFKEVIGLPPHQYLLRRRVERAKALLSKRDLPLAEVAVLVGFGDQSHLTRCFKRFTGITPKRFRN